MLNYVVKFLVLLVLFVVNLPVQAESMQHPAASGLADRLGDIRAYHGRATWQTTAEEGANAETTSVVGEVWFQAPFLFWLVGLMT